MLRSFVLLLGSVLILTVLNGIIIQKEAHIAQSIEIKVKLRPVDPRSLMQGDYMQLRYDLQLKEKGDLPPFGLLKITLDEDHGVTASKLYQGETLQSHEHLLAYTKKRYGELHIAADSFMFEEGKAHHYARATHAILLLDSEGKTLLKDLFVPKDNR